MTTRCTICSLPTAGDDDDDAPCCGHCWESNMSGAEMSAPGAPGRAGTSQAGRYMEDTAGAGRREGGMSETITYQGRTYQVGGGYHVPCPLPDWLPHVLPWPGVRAGSSGDPRALWPRLPQARRRAAGAPLLCRMRGPQALAACVGVQGGSQNSHLGADEPGQAALRRGRAHRPAGHAAEGTARQYPPWRAAPVSLPGRRCDARFQRGGRNASETSPPPIMPRDDGEDALTLPDQRSPAEARIRQREGGGKWLNGAHTPEKNLMR